MSIAGTASFWGRGIIPTCKNSIAVKAAEATESLPKEASLVLLDGPLGELDLTKIMIENFEDNGPEETSPSDDAVDEAEPVEEST